MDTGPSSVFGEDSVDFFAIVVLAWLEFFHFLFGDDSILILIDETEEGPCEVFVFSIYENNY